MASVLACIGLLREAQAVVPPPDGGYPGGNTAEGQNALLSLTTGVQNTAVGFLSLKSDTTGSYNTAIGSGTLFANTADGNTATGAFALLSNTIGGLNTANGAVALFSNTEGSSNNAVGYQALRFNTTGYANNAFGVNALFSNTIGFGNTAVGDNAIFSNTTGNINTAVGDNALFSNITGSGNMAVGHNALFSNTTGNVNIAIGESAMNLNSTGGGNTAIGRFSLFHNISGIKNIALGISAGHLTTGSDNIDIGNIGVEGESSTIRIGTQAPASSHNELPLPGTQTATYIAGIHGATATNGLAVFVDMDGKLGTLTSSARFKDDIKPMDKASESIFDLKPVRFRYKNHIDAKATPQFGLIAEEVEVINPDLVVRDKEGKPYTVRYEQVNAMLLNEFLKEHKNVQELKATLGQQQKEIAALIGHIKEQDAKIQRVSDQIEMSKAAPRVAGVK